MAAAIAAAFALVSPSAAQADIRDHGTPTIPQGSDVAVSHRCVLYANAKSFGADCVGGDAKLTVQQLLDGDKFAECRYELAPDDVSTEKDPPGKKGAWWVETCLRGIKPNGTGDFTRTTQVLWFDEGDEPPALTLNQQKAWNTFKSVYPSPTAQFGPATAPRVLIPTFFWLTDSSGNTISHTVYDGTRNVTMRARVEQIEVSPGVREDEQPFTCKAPLRSYDHSLGIYNQPGNCTYEYDRSSAFKPDDVYEVIVQADWVVEYQGVDGNWIPLGGEVRLAQITKTPVDEIQTIVG